MTLLLDAGAFIAIERGDAGVEALLRSERARGRPPVTHGGIVGQVWRDGARQAVLARLFRGTTVVPLTAGLGRDAGRLLAATGGNDVVDAALIALAKDGDEIVTADPADLSRLAEACGLQVTILVP